MYPHDASCPEPSAGLLADSIRALQQRRGTPNEGPADFAELCGLLHAWHNARTVQPPPAAGDSGTGRHTVGDNEAPLVPKDLQGPASFH